MRIHRVVLPIFLLTVFALVAATSQTATPAAAATTSIQTPTPPAVKEIELTAKKYEFSMKKVEVPLNTVVRFKITALDREHGFEVEDVKDSCIEIPKGETKTFEYKATKAGTFKFKCCHFCGLGHSGMKGELIVK